jgi:hypothetical protein
VIANQVLLPLARYTDRDAEAEDISLPQTRARLETGNDDLPSHDRRAAELVRYKVGVCADPGDTGYVTESSPSCGMWRSRRDTELLHPA